MSIASLNLMAGVICDYDISFEIYIEICFVVSCPVDPLPQLQCNLEDLPSQEDVDMDRVIQCFSIFRLHKSRK